MFLDATAVMVSDSNKNVINFEHNIARILGSSVYQEMSQLCYSSCLSNRITGINNRHITTPPDKLQFDNPY